MTQDKTPIEINPDGYVDLIETDKQLQEIASQVSLNALAGVYIPLQKEPIEVWLDKIQCGFNHREHYQHGFHDAIQVVKDNIQQFLVASSNAKALELLTEISKSACTCGVGVKAKNYLNELIKEGQS